MKHTRRPQHPTLTPEQRRLVAEIGVIVRATPHARPVPVAELVVVAENIADRARWASTPDNDADDAPSVDLFNGGALV